MFLAEYRQGKWDRDPDLGVEAETSRWRLCSGPEEGSEGASEEGQSSRR